MWQKMIGHATERIHAGELNKVVLSRAAELRFEQRVRIYQFSIIWRRITLIVTVSCSSRDRTMLFMAPRRSCWRACEAIAWIPWVWPAASVAEASLKMICAWGSIAAQPQEPARASDRCGQDSRSPAAPDRVAGDCARGLAQAEEYTAPAFADPRAAQTGHGHLGTGGIPSSDAGSGWRSAATAPCASSAIWNRSPAAGTARRWAGSMQTSTDSSPWRSARPLRRNRAFGYTPAPASSATVSQKPNGKKPPSNSVPCWTRIRMNIRGRAILV